MVCGALKGSVILFYLFSFITTLILYCIRFHFPLLLSVSLVKTELASSRLIGLIENQKVLGCCSACSNREICLLQTKMTDHISLSGVSSV